MAEITLLEQAATIENEQARKYANVFATAYPATALLPFVQMSGFKFPFTVADRLPSVNPRNFGTDFTEDFGKHSNYDIEWKIYGGKFSLDKALAAGNPTGARKQLILQIQAASKQMAQHMFEGTGGTQMVGLLKLLKDVYPAQVVNSSSSTANGDAISMSLMDQLMEAVPDADAIFCTKFVHRALNILSRTTVQQNINYEIDQFGTKVMHYNRVPIYSMVDHYDGSDILSTTLRDGANANNTTSAVYAIKYGSDAVHGFSPDVGGLMAETVNPGTHAEITRIESRTGIVQVTPRTAGVIVNVKQS